MSSKERKDAMYEHHPYGEAAVEERLESAKKYRGREVLVAGCGAGTRLFDRYFEGANVTGLDQSSRAIEFVRAQFDELGVEPPELIIADLLDVDLPADRYDYVLCYGVLHHTTDPAEALRRLGRACKNDGRVELLLYHRNSLVRFERSLVESAVNVAPLGRFLSDERKRRFEWWDKYENPIWETYTVAEATRLVRSAGLSVEEQRMGGRLFDDVSRLFLPPIVRLGLRRLLDGYRWHVRIDASPT